MYRITILPVVLHCCETLALTSVKGKFALVLKHHTLKIYAILASVMDGS
jgi:hypothetical protein